jgi:flagellar basal body-associated protein FliL
VLAWLLVQLLQRFSFTLRLDEATLDLIIVTLVLGILPVVIITWMFAAPSAASTGNRTSKRLKDAFAAIERLRTIPDKQTDTGQN